MSRPAASSVARRRLCDDRVPVVVVGAGELEIIGAVCCCMMEGYGSFLSFKEPRSRKNQ